MRQWWVFSALKRAFHFAWVEWLPQLERYQMFLLEDEISVGLDIGVLHHTTLGHILNSGETSVASGEGSPLGTSLTPSPEQMDSRDTRNVVTVITRLPEGVWSEWLRNRTTPNTGSSTSLELVQEGVNWWFRTTSSILLAPGEGDELLSLAMGPGRDCQGL